MPTDVGLPSVKARAGSWHVAQATVPSPESRLSKNSFSPSATMAGGSGLTGGVTDAVSAAGKSTCSCDRGCAKGPAFGSGGARSGASAGGGAQPPASLTPRGGTTPQKRPEKTPGTEG